jgi:elongin-A
MYGTRSLAETCLKVAVDNIHLINNLGGAMPPHFLQPILRAVKTAAQLHELEVNSDDIYDETAKHWQRFITRDFRALSTKHNYVPQDRKSWHKVYDKYKKLQDEQIAAATEKLRQEFAAHDEHKHSRTSHIISGQQSTKLRPAKAKAGWNAPREKKTFIRKTRDRVRLEASRFNLRTPTGKLIVPPGQINKKVAENRLHELRIASLPSASLAPARRPGAKTASELDRERMEERLRRIKNPTESNSGIPANVIAFSDDENDTEPRGRSAKSKNKNDDLFGDLESDDIFDDPKPKKTATSAVSSSKGSSVPRTATTQSTKRRWDAEETTTEQPAKRRRADEESATSRPPQPATILRRSKLLSAAPGANAALLARKPAPPQTSTRTNAPPKPSATAPTRGQLQSQTATKQNTPSRHSVSATVPGQPPRSNPLGPPVAPRHPLEPPVDDERARRLRLYGDGTVAPNPNDSTRRVPLHKFGPASQRRIQILRPNIWPKRFMK